MAEEIDNDPSDANEASALGRRSRRQMADRQRRAPRAARAATPRAGRGGIAKPARTVVILAMVGGLIVAAGLPAYAAWNPGSNEMTVEQMAAVNSQSLVVASDVTTGDLARDSYAATTSDELDAKKAAEAAAAAAARAASSAASAASVPSSVNLNMVAPGSGAVRWPLDMSQITVGRGFGADGYHQGVDLLGAFGTNEYAAAAGTVSFAGWSGGYGQVVFIDHVINGVSVSTAYAHMSTILVSQGQTVQAGQLIGLMGMTGSATANHLHFEVRINGGTVDPWAWLVQNAG
ncbi:M23 family metallopeptidase [Microbacterium sp. SORGH_AS_0888]|uniref:M23 family metallopeptidase n=1 Tax=Microbacterium sp. SORGH_AS_0888 TaxID=3041791 RepID=UPI002783C25B|nr:M23 family metallopeptidase [Microbacterium sp. SORGH_AS_0888]MDQ1131105.1 murein DD-endopeptidase MepM/ murein hydrolase activator NlpD [Microbacterium sp. SORGH_AS_0888]